MTETPPTKPSEDSVQARGPWSEKSGEWTAAGFDNKTTSVARFTKHELTIALTDEEKARLAEDIAQTYAEDLALDEEKKEFLAEWKAKKQHVASRRSNKISAVHTGKEKRIVECAEVYDHQAGAHYFLYARKNEEPSRYLERPMKEPEYLVGMPKLFVEEQPTESNVTEIRPAKSSVEGKLVATSEDGKVTKFAKPAKRYQPPGPGMTVAPGSELDQVMREEKNPRTKHDHTT